MVTKLRRLLGGLHWPRKAAVESQLDEEMQESLEFWRERDPQENEETRPPDEEEIACLCIWVTEFYLSSQTAELISLLRRLGWSTPDTPGRQAVDDWIRDHSVAPGFGACMDLGVVQRPGEHRVWGPRRLTGPLPSAVAYASCSLHHIAATMFALVVEFVLTDEGAAKIDVELRKDRETSAERIPNGWAFNTPENQKVEACHRARADLRASCASWLKEHLPGLYSKMGGPEDFPTAEFFTFKQASPFRPSGDGPPGYLRVLRMNHDLDTWASSQLPGLTVTYPTFDESERANLVLAVSEREFLPDIGENRWRSYGGRNRAGYITALSSYHDTLVLWALIVLQDWFERRLAKHRASVSTVSLAKATKASPELRELQRQVLKLSRDMMPAVLDIRRLTESPEFFHRRADTLSPLSEVRRKELHFLEEVRQRLQEGVGRLSDSELLVREAIQAQASLVSSEVQERATDKIVLLTAVLTVLTLVLVGLSLALLLNA